MKFFKKKNKIDKPRTIVIDSLKYKSNGVLLPFVFQALLLCVTLVGFLLSVASSIEMSINAFAIILIAVPIMFLSMLLTLNTKIYIAYLSFFSASAFLVFGVIKSLRDKIFEAFVFCYNLTVQRMVDQGYANYKNALTEDIIELLDNEPYKKECFYTVIIVLSIVFSFIFASTLLKRSLVLFSALPCFAILTPSLYFGSTPSGVSFSIFISGILGCYIESIAFILRSKKSKKALPRKKKNKKNNLSLGRTMYTSTSGFACMCISLMLSLTISMSLFSSNGMQITSIRNAIDRLANKMMNFLFYESFETAEGAVGGLLDGEFLDLKTPKFRDLPVMTVTTEKNSSLYLRGWIGREFTNEGWRVLGDDETKAYNSAVSDGFDENTQFYNYTKIVAQQQLKDAKSDEETSKLGFIYDTVDVKAKYSKSKMIFTPVKCLDGEIKARHSGIELVGDTITFFKKGRSEGNAYKYTAAIQTFADRDFYLSFNNNQKLYLTYADSVLSKSGSLNKTEQFIVDERNYAKYVNATYLSLPENSNFLRQIALTETQSYSKSIAKALAIERYFKTNFSYVQKTPNFKEDVQIMDKIGHVINVSKEGYCTYFASAMTIMMRHLGLPARYVTGYHAMISSDDKADQYVRKINDENYHAWVEVYFDGIGWLTFDPTPGMSSDISVRDYDYLDDAEVEDLPEPEMPDDLPLDENGDTPVTEAPLISAPVKPVAPEESEITDIIGSDDEEEEDTKYKYDKELPEWVFKLIIAILLLILIVGAVILFSAVVKFKYNSYISGLKKLNPRDLVCTVYPDILRLLGSVKYKPKPGEMITEFVERVDKGLILPITLKSILRTLEMSQFSENDIEFKHASRVYEYYNILSDAVYRKHNIVKRYYYMITLKLRKRK